VLTVVTGDILREGHVPVVFYGDLLRKDLPTEEKRVEGGTAMALGGESSQVQTANCKNPRGNVRSVPKKTGGQRAQSTTDDIVSTKKTTCPRFGGGWGVGGTKKSDKWFTPGYVYVAKSSGEKEGIPWNTILVDKLPPAPGGAFTRGPRLVTREVLSKGTRRSRGLR